MWPSGYGYGHPGNVYGIGYYPQTSMSYLPAAGFMVPPPPPPPLPLPPPPPPPSCPMAIPPPGYLQSSPSSVRVRPRAAQTRSNFPPSSTSVVDQIDLRAGAPSEKEAGSRLLDIRKETRSVWRSVKCRRCEISKNVDVENCTQCKLLQSHLSHSEEENSSSQERQLDMMFSKWEAAFQAWKEENKNNPDQVYVRNHIEQMNALGNRMLERRENLRRQRTQCGRWRSINTPHNSHPIVNMDLECGSEDEASSNISTPRDTKEIQTSFSTQNTTEMLHKRRRTDNDETPLKIPRQNDTNNSSASQKGSKGVRRLGDWICRQCEKLNFAFRKDCKFCFMSKEIMVDEELFSRRSMEGNETKSVGQLDRSDTSEEIFQRKNSVQDESLLFERRGDSGCHYNVSRVVEYDHGLCGRPQWTDSPSTQWPPPNWRKTSESPPAQRQRLQSTNNQRTSGRDDEQMDLRGHSSLSRSRRRRRGGEETTSFQLDFKRENNNTIQPTEGHIEATPLEGDVVAIDDLIQPPGRYTRPPKIVIILRGLPGSGKSYIAKNIKTLECELSSETPRILALDDYFECDGKYDYDVNLEDSYRTSLIKSFKKQIDDGYFAFIIVDCINHKNIHYKDFWSYAKQKGFEVYVGEVQADVETCCNRNIHDRSKKDIMKLFEGWQPTPSHYNKVDFTTLLQDTTIKQVEMEDVSESVTGDGSDKFVVANPDSEDEEAMTKDSTGQQHFPGKVSKWEKMEKMAQLDGVSQKAIRKLAEQHSIKDWLEVSEYETKTAGGGDDDDDDDDDDSRKKRVKWADMEEMRQQTKMRDIGFVVGHTNWERLMDPTDGGSALTKTKIIPNRFQE